MTLLASTPMTQKEGEAIMWGLAQIGDYLDRETDDKSDPLYILLAKGYDRRAIDEACQALWEVAYGDLLSEPWTSLERDILRCCVENTSWIWHYCHHEPTASDPYEINKARAALRSLARKLDETFDIDINYLPEH